MIGSAYYASQKYLINPLISKCEQFIYSIMESNSTSINDIIKIYCQSIDCGCLALADKIEEKLTMIFKEKDNTKLMLVFMQFFNKIVSNCNNIKMVISNRDQHIFNILLHSLLKTKRIKLNQENVQTILISCKNYILNLPPELFLKWFVENQLFNVNKQKMHDMCVEYCKHFITRVGKHSSDGDSTIAINNTNCRMLSWDGDDYDIDIDNLSTFDLDLNFTSWKEMLKRLFIPSIRTRYSDTTKIEESKEKDSGKTNEEYIEQIWEISNILKTVMPKLD